MVLKELIFNSFYCWKSCGALEGTDYFTVSMMEECGGLERTDFLQLYN